MAEHLGEGLFGRRGRLDQAHRRVELARPVVGHGVGLGQLVALALLGDHVQELRALEVANVLQRGDQRVEVVAVDGADVVEAELLEQRGRHHHALGMLLEAFGQLEQGRRGLEHTLAHVFGGGVELAAHQPGQVAVQRTHGRADGHVVVVEHHQQPGVMLHARVIQRLEGHTGAHGAVADDGHGIPVFTLLLRCQGHAQRSRDGGAGVRRAEGVVCALGTLRETRDAAELPQGGHAITPAGEDLVRIGLVAHVPHQPVFGRVEHMVQGHGQLDGAQVGAEVPAGLGDTVQHIGAQLAGQGFQLGPAHAPQVGRAVHAGQQRVGRSGRQGGRYIRGGCHCSVFNSYMR